MRTLLKRELTSLALWVGTYALAVGFIIISGVFFINLVSSNKSADLASYYANIVNMFGLICPILGARSLAEERGNGALLVSLSWPVPRWALVLSKFVANTLFSWLLLSISWIYYNQLTHYARPDHARVLGGWVGMLLIIMLFNSISLAVSARCATAVSATFLSFVVLLFLLVVKYLPESFRDHLETFGPIDHLDPFLRGIIYFSDVTYFVILSLAGLLAATYAISRRRAGSDRQIYLRRGLAVAASIGVVLATPGAARAVTGSDDLTPQKRETVSLATKEILKKVGNIPIVITAFTQNISLGAAQVNTTVRKYKAAGANITSNLIDPDISPALAEATGITDYETYQIQVGDKKEEIDDLVESTVTSTIAQLGQASAPVACFVDGHGERRIDDLGAEGLTSFAARLRIIGYDPARIYLSGKGAEDLIKQCQVVIEMGPRTTLLPPEMTTLQDYAKANGRLIVAADSVRGDIDQMNQLVSPYGLTLSKESIRDPESLADDPAAIVSTRYPTSSSVVDVLYHDRTPVIFNDSLAVDKVPGFGDAGAGGPQLTQLVQSSPRSYKVDANGKTVPNTTATYTLASMSNSTQIHGSNTDAVQFGTIIGAVGSADIASNEYQKSFGDQEFFIRLLQQVARSNDIVSAFRDIGENSQFNITAPQRQALIKKTVVLPSLAALIFVPFVLWRLKRG
ncbi:MAG TPA: Gldg family protein [Sporichthyaceae bacterium]|nr:Gldg family protein [Sporichthyaceae bacterium]